METICNGMLPFLGIQLLNRSPQIQQKGVRKTAEFKSAFTLAESYAQSVQPQTGFAENNAGLSISFIFLLLTFLRRM